MFKKADLNGDQLIDLNEFLWIQTPTSAPGNKGAAHETRGVHPAAPPPTGEGASGEVGSWLV